MLSRPGSLGRSDGCKPTNSRFPFEGTPEKRLHQRQAKGPGAIQSLRDQSQGKGAEKCPIARILMLRFLTSRCWEFRHPEVRIFNTNNKKIRIRDNNMKPAKMKGNQSAEKASTTSSEPWEYQPTSLFPYPYPIQQHLIDLPTISF